MSLPLMSLFLIMSAALMPAAQTAKENMPAALAPNGLAHQGLQHLSTVSSVIRLVWCGFGNNRRIAPLQMHQHPTWWHHTAGGNTELSDQNRCNHGKTEETAQSTCFMKTKSPNLGNAGDHSYELLLLRVSRGRVVNIWDLIKVPG